MSSLLNPAYREWLWIAGENGVPSIKGGNAGIFDVLESARMILDPLVSIHGTNIAAANVSRNVEGGIDVVTVATAGNQTILVPHEDDNACLMNPASMTWGSDREAEFECLIKTPSVLTNLIIMAGFKTDDGPADMAVTDQGLVVFQYDTSAVADTNWKIVADDYDGSDDVELDSGVTVVASTIYKLGIKCDHAGIAHCFINDEEVAAVDFSGGADDWVPMIGYQRLSVGTAAPALRVYGWRVARKYGASN